jgi:hypothetical protein
MKCHIVISVLYVFLGVWGTSLIGYGAKLFVLLIFPGVFVFLHALLAYGSYKGIEISRKASEMVFVLIGIGAPIGTLIAIFFLLPTTQWETPKDV